MCQSHLPMRNLVQQILVTGVMDTLPSHTAHYGYSSTHFIFIKSRGEGNIHKPRSLIKKEVSSLSTPILKM